MLLYQIRHQLTFAQDRRFTKYIQYTPLSEIETWSEYTRVNDNKCVHGYNSY